MSRIGNNPIKIPEGVSVSITPEQITVKGKMGELTQFYDGVSLEQVENTLVVKRNSDTINKESQIDKMKIKKKNTKKTKNKTKTKQTKTKKKKKKKKKIKK